MIVGLLHPGEMGSAVGAALRANGHDVVWASSGRSEDTARRALEAGLRDGGIGAPSALKLTYAAWSKGTAALVLAIRDVARANGVEGSLRAQWGESASELPQTLSQAERSAGEKGWRWIGEMEEIADTFAAAGQPDGFHRAAAQVCRQWAAR